MIEEKALVKCMKAAYSGGGLNVWRLDWEGFDALFINSGYWAVLMPMSYAPSKVLALITEYAIECKRIASGNLGYSCFTGNEIENLSRYEDAGGCSIVAIRRDAPSIICFVPWYAVRDAVLAGERGSIRLEEWPKELVNAEEAPRPIPQGIGACRVCLQSRNEVEEAPRG